MGAGGDRMSRLSTKPPQDDPDRRKHQAQVKRAIIQGQTFGLTYLLARVKNFEPYENYRVPKTLAEFEFTLKGVLRLEMMEHNVYRGWRRLFGSNTKAQDISSWRSRIMIKAFDNLVDTRAYLDADPLFNWSQHNFPWTPNLIADDWYVLFQIQDVLIAEEKDRWANAFGRFLQSHSALLELVISYDILEPVIGGVK